MRPQFSDRFSAGHRLAEDLGRYADNPDVVVLALPRGGVPVAYEVARALRAPLDVMVVRKLGVPGHAELAMGAIASGDVRVLNDDVIRSVGISTAAVDEAAANETAELERREQAYRGDRAALDVRGKTVLLVDDGLATGATMRAAAAAVRRRGPARVIVAVPVAAAGTGAELLDDADDVVCLATPEPFLAVGLWYEHFDQTTDEEVRTLLDRAHGLRNTSAQRGEAGRAASDQADASADAAARTAADRAADPPAESTASHETIDQATDERAVRIASRDIRLDADLTLPDRARGVILFAHGSGSSRKSPRNRLVARQLQELGFATLLLDLLTAAEERIDLRTRHLRFDIPLLARRLVAAADWLAAGDGTTGLPIGAFGASTGAAAALIAAAERPEAIRAVVSRGGRPDLATDALPRVHAPTLLIVGALDSQVIPLNQSAFDVLAGEKQLVLVPGATHLFEEPGALDEVSRLAGEWFTRHLTGPSA